MGKLTDSLKDTSQQLSKVKDGLRQMQALGEGIADNAQTVAEAGLRVGYAYAQVEAARAEVDKAETASSAPESWTMKSLKAEFGSAAKAYAHLKEEHGVTLRSRSWVNILAAFNGEQLAVQNNRQAARNLTPSSLPQHNHSLENRVTELERLANEQAKRIIALEAKLELLLNHLPEEV